MIIGHDGQQRERVSHADIRMGVLVMLMCQDGCVSQTDVFEWVC